MAKGIDPSVLNDGLNLLDVNVTRIALYNAEPSSGATYNSGPNASKLIGSIAMAGTQLSIADGAIDGRTLTVLAQTGVTADVVGGTVTHIAIIGDDGAANIYPLVWTTCNDVVLALNDTLDIPTFEVRFRDPA
jgi:hypothetical protein